MHSAYPSQEFAAYEAISPGGRVELVVEPDPQVLLVLALLAQRDLLDSPVGPDQPAKMAQPVLLDPPVLAEKSETRA